MTPEISKRLYLTNEVSAATERIRTRIWTRIKTAYSAPRRRRSAPEAGVVGIVERLAADDRAAPLAEDLDLERPAGQRQVAAHVGERGNRSCFSR